MFLISASSAVRAAVGPASAAATSGALSLAGSDQPGALANGILVALAQLLDQWALQQLGGRDVGRVVRSHFGQLVALSLHPLLSRLHGGQLVAELLHLLAQHVRLGVRVERQHILVELVLVERPLTRLQLTAHFVQLLPKPVTTRRSP